MCQVVAIAATAERPGVGKAEHRSELLLGQCKAGWSGQARDAADLRDRCELHVGGSRREQPSSSIDRARCGP